MNKCRECKFPTKTIYCVVCRNIKLLTNKITMSVKIEREAQKPQKPNARVGDNQAERIPTHEGSMLGSPTAAGNTAASMPSDKQAQS